MDSKIGGVPGRGIPVQGKNTGKVEGEYHVSTLEVEGGHLSVGTGTVVAV